MRSKHFESYGKSNKIGGSYMNNNKKLVSEVWFGILFGLDFWSRRVYGWVMFRVRVPLYMLSPVPAFVELFSITLLDVHPWTTRVRTLSDQDSSSSNEFARDRHEV